MTAADNSEPSGLLARAWRFLHKPPEEKAQSFYARWIRLFPRIPMPVRLPFGGWWLARNDFLGSSIIHGGFEDSERSFVERFLKLGMVVLDIGANQGFYTLLASRLVGPSGKVISFEPSLRERNALLLHKMLNRCRNVSVQSLALGEKTATADFYVVKDTHTGLNSLRPPVGIAQTSIVRVEVDTLDAWLHRQELPHVDFIKLDVEGGELAVLKGASELLRRLPRPVILAEVEDIRTLPWGYCAKEIIEFLSARKYRWFLISGSGSLIELGVNSPVLDGNFVAVPDERMREVAELAEVESRPSMKRGDH